MNVFVQIVRYFNTYIHTNTTSEGVLVLALNILILKRKSGS